MKSLAVALFAILPIACLGAGFSYKPYDDLGTHDRVIVTNVTFDGLTSPSEVTNISQYVVSQSVSSPTNAVTKQTRVTVNGISGELSSNVSFSVSTGISGPYVRTVNGASNDVTVATAAQGALAETALQSESDPVALAALAAFAASNHIELVYEPGSSTSWWTFTDGALIRHVISPVIDYNKAEIFFPQNCQTARGYPCPLAGSSIMCVLDEFGNFSFLFSGIGPEEGTMSWHGSGGREPPSGEFQGFVVDVGIEDSRWEGPIGIPSTAVPVDYGDGLPVGSITANLGWSLQTNTITYVAKTEQQWQSKADATNVIHFSDGQAVALTGGVVTVFSGQQATNAASYAAALATNALVAAYQAASQPFTTNLTSSASTTTVIAAWGSVPAIVITAPTVLSLDASTYATTGVCRVSCNFWSGTNGVTLSTNVTYDSTPTISTNSWNTILFRRVKNNAWKGVGL